MDRTNDLSIWRRAFCLILCLSATITLCACVDSPSTFYLGSSSAGTFGASPKEPASRIGDPFRDLGGAEPANGTNYQLGPADILGISVFQVPELNMDAQVSSDGTVVLPLVGVLKVGGKQAQDVERELTGRLGAKYLKSPQVSVFVKSYNSQKIVVSGAVVSPGTLSLTGATTLTSAIADAKGLTDVADQHNVAVFRRVNGEKFAARFDLDDLATGKVADVRLQKGDVVVVDTSDWKYGLKNYLPMATYGAIFTRL